MVLACFELQVALPRFGGQVVCECETENWHLIFMRILFIAFALLLLLWLFPIFSQPIFGAGLDQDAYEIEKYIGPFKADGTNALLLSMAWLGDIVKP